MVQFEGLTLEELNRLEQELGFCLNTLTLLYVHDHLASVCTKAMSGKMIVPTSMAERFGVEIGAHKGANYLSRLVDYMEHDLDAERKVILSNGSHYWNVVHALFHIAPETVLHMENLDTRNEEYTFCSRVATDLRRLSVADRTAFSVTPSKQLQEDYKSVLQLIIGSYTAFQPQDPIADGHPTSDLTKRVLRTLDFFVATEVLVSGGLLGRYLLWFGGPQFTNTAEAMLTTSMSCTGPLLTFNTQIRRVKLTENGNPSTVLFKPVSTDRHFAEMQACLKVYPQLSRVSARFRQSVDGQDN